MAHTVVPGTNRHLCPLPDCDWRYDEPPFTLADTAGIAPDPSSNIEEAIRSVVERAAYRRTGAVESAVRAHVATHGIYTVDELRAVIGHLPPGL